jgi:hypothetical protein
MGKREQIVAYCRKQLGCAYSYTPSGGKEGSAYNCSYLSTCAYKAAGLAIPRWQGHQNGDGSQSDWVYRNGHWTTNPSKLKVGDLVFFGSSRTNTTHVGIVSKAGTIPYIIDSTPSRGVAERKLPVSAGFVGGGWPMKSLPKESTPTVKAGTYECVVARLNVRDKPTTSGSTVKAQYKRGETVNLTSYAHVANGYVWGRYKGATSGQWRYVAVRKVGGDTYLRKV